MLRRIDQIVLILLLLMAVLSPFMQLSSFDQFPAAGDDLETQIICGLCGIGILLALARILQVVQTLSYTQCLIPARTIRLCATDEFSNGLVSPHWVIPLRILSLLS